MRACLVVIIATTLTATAVAHPRTAPTMPADPALAPVAATWRAAAAEGDPAQASARWRSVALMLDAIARTDGPTPRSGQRAAAYGAVLAWRAIFTLDVRIKVVPVTPPPPPRLTDDERSYLAALDRYLELATDADPDRPGIRFTRAMMLARGGEPDRARPDLIEILDHHRDTEFAAYAANLLLDGLNQAERYDELLSWARRLRTDTDFTRRNPDLDQVLRSLDRQGHRHAAERAEAAARAGDATGFATCAREHLEAYNVDPDAGEGPELLYNAAVCAESDGAVGLAMVSFRRIVEGPQRASVRPRALARLGALTYGVALFDQSAQALEQLATDYPGERDAASALADAVVIRSALGQLDLARRDLTALARIIHPRRDEALVTATLTVVDGYLAAADRSGARRLLAGLGSHPRDAALAIARRQLDAACARTGGDGRCRTWQDRALRDRALATLATSTTPADRLRIADATADPARAADAYARLAVDAGTDPDLTRALDARLGRPRDRERLPYSRGDSVDAAVVGTDVEPPVPYSPTN